MTFEVFHARRRTNALPDNVVSINSQGVVSIPEQTWKRIGSPDRVQILLDRQIKRMRLQGGHEHTYAVGVSRSVRMVRCLPALECIGWEKGCGGIRVPAQVVDDGVEFFIERS